MDRRQIPTVHDLTHLLDSPPHSDLCGKVVTAAAACPEVAWMSP